MKLYWFHCLQMSMSLLSCVITSSSDPRYRDLLDKYNRRVFFLKFFFILHKNKSLWSNVAYFLLHDKLLLFSNWRTSCINWMRTSSKQTQYVLYKHISIEMYIKSIYVYYWRTTCCHSKMFLFTNIEHVITTLSTVKIYVNIGHMSTCIYKHHKLQTNEINDR